MALPPHKGGRARERVFSLPIRGEGWGEGLLEEVFTLCAAKITIIVIRTKQITKKMHK